MLVVQVRLLGIDVVYKEKMMCHMYLSFDV